MPNICPMRKRASTAWRRSYATVSPIQAIDNGMSAPAVAPASVRAITSAPNVGVSVHRNDVIAQPKVASVTTRYLP